MRVSTGVLATLLLTVTVACGGTAQRASELPGVASASSPTQAPATASTVGTAAPTETPAPVGPAAASPPVRSTIAPAVQAASPSTPTRVPRTFTAVPATHTPVVTPVSTDGDVGSEVDDHIPEFEFLLTDGSKVTSTGLLSESRPVFLFFFAQW